MSQIRSIANGGGVQSAGMVTLAAHGEIDFDTALFANVGEDSEAPSTLAFVRHILIPYGEHHGLRMVEVQKTIGGEPDSILGKIERTAHSEVIPVRSTADGPPMSRSCTADFKIETMGRWLRDHGAGPDNPARVGIGISLDEMGRAGRQPRPWEQIVYPLLEHQPRALRRTDCERIVAAEPLPACIAHTCRELGPDTFGPVVWGRLQASDFQFMPVPEKSSCWFCPHHSYEAWQDLRRADPSRFQRACGLEHLLTVKAGAPRYLTRYGIPLAEAINEGVDPLTFPDPNAGGCLSGACAT